MVEIIGWSYEADIHCYDCAQKRFGVALDMTAPKSAVDNEGNLVHPIFSTDETPPSGEYCGDCQAEIAAPWLQQGYEVFQGRDYNSLGTSNLEDGKWYWWLCQPGCLPDGEPSEGFGSEKGAIIDAGQEW